MRFLIAAITAGALAAQNAPPAAPADQAKPAEAAPAPSPEPSTGNWLSGSIDIGYRWQTGVFGSLAAYRSIVDYNSGPKLLNADFTITDPQRRLFDRIRVRASDWGDDPYEAFHLDAEKSRWYRFNADYRDMAYFNFLPSYADPLLGRGILLDQQSFAIRKHLASFSLDLLPGGRFVPYFAYDRDVNSGSGIATFVTSANPFPVPENDDNLTNLYRGGLRMEFRRFHATLEEGGTTFRDDESLFQNPGAPNYGDAPGPVLGQTTALASLLAAYGIRGTSTYTKALFTANALSWLDLYGQFLYSQPSTAVHYQQTDTGNLVLQNPLLFYSSEAYLATSAAKLPHTTASFGGEVRPLRRVRILESWLTDRLHNAGSAAQNDMLGGPLSPNISQQIAAALASSLVTNYSQEETDVMIDATATLMLRGGYRYVWGDAADAILPPEGLASSDQARLRRNVGLGGFRYRPIPQLLLSAEAEVGRSGADYFRTSLYNYERVRAQARYQLSKSFNLAADVTSLANNNPAPGVNYDYSARQESLSLFWTPKSAIDFQGSYTRSSVRSDIGYLTPQNLTAQTSLYTDNTHVGTMLLNLAPALRKDFAPRISAGGSVFVSSGSRPTRFYQPMASLWLPLRHHVSWFAQWQYYGYGEPFYIYEGFRSNLVTTGLRLSR